MLTVLIVLACAIIAGLSFYAGKLLYQLREQTLKQEQAREARVERITESIQTIAFAMQQQQCDLSEGVIRLYHLLDALPVLPQPDFATHFPAVHSLYDRVCHFPTHEARNALSKAERRQQDKEREEIESIHEADILKELDALKVFDVTFYLNAKLTTFS
ncbi:DUF2489 domain-containing protein [Alteromonas facilis]|uniref:DUF2489 domain-containing protein n=1 Tax=Alteromonas facilis TaxID=2048004 RepID=UPI000C28B15D|nr:DUF2489 domain-containing protein [Alteromonas facilis]